MKQNVTASLIVIVHLLVLLIHGSEHLNLHIDTQRCQSAFIAIVIFLGPVLATAMLWAGLQKSGAVVMALTMAGAFAFGVINHFLLPGSDNAFEIKRGQWAGSMFVISAIGLGFIEAGGFVWGLMALKNSSPFRR